VITEQKRKVLDLFSEGRKQYKLMEFGTAADYFRKALEIDPNDGPSKVYLERCEVYVETPPPEDWDGVFVMTTK
jgi:tetratricopeptide (TPR) repeat protein